MTLGSITWFEILARRALVKKLKEIYISVYVCVCVSSSGRFLLLSLHLGKAT